MLLRHEPPDIDALLQRKGAACHPTQSTHSARDADAGSLLDRAQSHIQSLYYGTYIYGGLGVPPTIAHVDAALRGVGELLPQVRTWLRDLHTRVRNGVGDPPFSCRSTINLTWTPRLGNGKGGGGRGG